MGPDKLVTSYTPVVSEQIVGVQLFGVLFALNA